MAVVALMELVLWNMHHMELIKRTGKNAGSVELALTAGFCAVEVNKSPGPVQISEQ